MFCFRAVCHYRLLKLHSSRWGMNWDLVTAKLWLSPHLPGWCYKMTVHKYELLVEKIFNRDSSLLPVWQLKIIYQLGSHPSFKVALTTSVEILTRHGSAKIFDWPLLIYSFRFRYALLCMFGHPSTC